MDLCTQRFWDVTQFDQSDAVCFIIQFYDKNIMMDGITMVTTATSMDTGYSFVFVKRHSHFLLCFTFNQWTRLSLSHTIFLNI